MSRVYNKLLYTQLHWLVYIFVSLFRMPLCFIKEFLIIQEARIAIEQVVIPKGESIELLPRPSNVMSLQMDLIQKYRLEAERIGTESDVRLRILPHRSRMDEEGKISERDSATGELDDFVSANGDPNGSLCIVDRLPLLPD